MILQGDVLEQLATLPDESVQCVVTSPPYWQLRDYKVKGQIGLEPTIEEYIGKLVEVFHEVRRVLRKDGTLWLNMGDSYARQAGDDSKKTISEFGGRHGPQTAGAIKSGNNSAPAGLKPKDLIGMPWRVALALQADGWYLRCDIIWSKPNPMPESVTDRPTKAHEYIFLMTKSAKYYYDNEAIKTAPKQSTIDDKRGNEDGSRNDRDYPGNASNGGTNLGGKSWPGIGPQHAKERARGEVYEPMTAHQKVNRRSVWEIPTQAYPDAHFATFPEMLVKLCILAGTSAKGCCSKCGAPWERQIEVNYKNDTTTDGRPAKGNRHKSVGNDIDRVMGYNERTRRIATTTGWRSTCECNAEIVPCTVMDIFGGSGTTAKVAQDEGRDWIVIELNPKYIPMIEKRVSNRQEILNI